MSEDKEKKGDKPSREDQEHFPTLSQISSVEEIGTQIGSYKLLSVLGEGGFGIVYLAEQKQPVRRQVALKVIKPGMDSKQVIARFESERQALALLDHPNIARIFDGGTTDAGRPYFVMELVKGLSITEYCDKHKLGIEERLELFQQVCEAVQHAHQKGIIHRDIKPSNILVVVQGGKPLPMIIDFGVAKAISQPLTEKTLFTEQGQFIGTPEYMSPEQAGMTIENVDMRSDIYSLGIVLYELLTGTLPFTRQELEQAGIGEIQRIIRETDPPHPSTRLSSLGEDAKKVAERRHTEVAALARRLHKELEWIPLKAMRKEPDRRYKTASELADDVRNYLRGDSLIAGPDSATYRMSKLVRKYRRPISTIVVALVLLIGFYFVKVAVTKIAGFWNVSSAPVWIGGSNKRSQPGVYGIKGVADPANMPGVRGLACSWFDKEGNLWIFGGEGIDGNGDHGRLNDLWKYDSTNWTWISGSNLINQPGVYGTKGVADPANVPGARQQGISWIDSNGNLWLFGGKSSDWDIANSDLLNDLWKFDGTNWTWVSGSSSTSQPGVYGTKGVPDPANLPGARRGSISWIDSSDNLWFFGGWSCFNSNRRLYGGEHNDLWKYDGSNWTWISGSNGPYQLPNYGTKGVADPTNIPGARMEGVSWIDTDGNLWLFGGAGKSINNSFGPLNDLWKYDGNNWIWVSGIQHVGQPSMYGTAGVASSANIPGARQISISWTDTDGYLWLFGGKVGNPPESYRYLNDLWKYDGTNWTWMGGSDKLDQPGVYGVRGVASKTNVCGGRCGSISWIDADGNLCLFGGDGYGSKGNHGSLNDMWKFDISRIRKP